MARRNTTEIIVLKEDSEGREETHPSWILVSFNNTSHSPPGADLFDSEISHQHTISLKITRCERKRRLGRDWFHPRETILEARMSAAQFGAIVSSFGRGVGVPATLEYLNGEMIASAPVERRLDESHREVKSAAQDAFAEVKAAADAVKQGFEDRVGRREMGPLVEHLTNRIGVAPANIEFAAKSLTEHVEKVVTKARGDVEGMVQGIIDANGVTALPEGTSLPVIDLDPPSGD